MSYAVGWDTFGGITALSVIAGVLSGLSLQESTDTSTIKWMTPALVFTGTTLLQLGFATPLAMLNRAGARKTLSWYYSFAAYFGVGASIAASPRSSIGSFMGMAMGVGAAALALTAFYILKNWPRISYAHGDAAMFLGSVHAVALIASAATAARYWTTTEKLSDWQSALIQTTQLSLTVLALPLAVGIWVRLRVRPEQPFPGGRARRPQVAPHPKPHTAMLELAPTAQGPSTLDPVQTTGSWIPVASGMMATIVLALVVTRLLPRK